jgi:2-epi-5-epi-valiolone synthase
MNTFLSPPFHFSCQLNHEYRITIIDSLFDPDNFCLAQAIGNHRVLAITTPTVYRLYGKRLIQQAHIQGLDLICEVMELNESKKTLDSVEKICKMTHEHGLGRSDILIAFGGGACSDTVGMAASLIRRGIRYLRIPTTLIGQVDAGIGLKGGVNFQGYKNYLGCFYPPSEVLIDPGLLVTLNRPFLSQGFAEIIKIALICDEELFGYIQLHGSRLLYSGFSQPANESSVIIKRSIKLMLEQLAENPFENRVSERLVDMGHTFSPYLEVASAFSITHGEAVAIDMALTSLISVELGLLTEYDALAIINLLLELGLPIWSPLMTRNLCDSAIKGMVLHRRGELNLVVLKTIGQPLFVKNSYEIEGRLLDRALVKLAEIGDSAKPNYSKIASH